MQRLSSFCTRYPVPLPIHLVLPRMASAAPIIAAARPTLIIPPNHLKNLAIRGLYGTKREGIKPTASFKSCLIHFYGLIELRGVRLRGFRSASLEASLENAVPTIQLSISRLKMMRIVSR